MEIARALALGRSLVRLHGLDGWVVVADRAKTRAGVCRPGKRQIGLSRPITELHSEQEVRDTILHEIAHALVGPQHGHDAVWQAKAREIGGTGERCLPADAPRPLGEWVGRCPAGHEKRRHRTPRRVESCGICSRRFDIGHLLTWSYRGGPVPMSAGYIAELAALRSASPVGAGRPAPQVGDVVTMVDGHFAERSGEVEHVGPTRVQVRVGDALVSVPLDAVRPSVRVPRSWSNAPTRRVADDLRGSRARVAEYRG
ncbi:MAG: SprT-like domain-containing protein [Dermatophilaceae bacterium]